MYKLNNTAIKLDRTNNNPATGMTIKPRKAPSVHSPPPVASCALPMRMVIPPSASGPHDATTYSHRAEDSFFHFSIFIIFKSNVLITGGDAILREPPNYSNLKADVSSVRLILLLGFLHNKLKKACKQRGRSANITLIIDVTSGNSKI